QAFALTGDAAATDPACALAPRHDLVVAARARAEAAPVPAPLRLRRFRPAS
ncbi:MAG TPA: pyrroloquinoline quinone biosynthesis protein PqqE, partial [Polyangia bacterium]|nr:pyrroloquinoline quinone biosynthesis protein PqqE [Polyangia bacterium]